jgi:AraC-like DNA-binding protein
MPAWSFYSDALQVFPLIVQPVPRQRPLGLHLHGSNAELVLVMRGSGEHLLHSQSFMISQGDIFMIPAGVLHGYAKCQDLALYNVLFDASRLALPEVDLGKLPGYRALFSLEPALRVSHGFDSKLHMSVAELERLRPLLEGMHQEVLERKPGYEVQLTGMFFTLLVQLARQYTDAPSAMSQSVLRLAGTLDWLERNLRSEVTVAQLAHRADMSPSTLGRAFKDCFGRSPMQYVTDLRVKKACELLARSERSVKEVAAAVGILDPNYFARVFRKHTGLEPSAYRAQARRADASPVSTSISSAELRRAQAS